MSTNNSVDSPLSGTTGTGNFVGSSGPTITSPIIVTSIKDVNNNNLFNLVATASSVNYFSFSNNVTGADPSLSAVGSDSNITLQLGGKGTGGVYIVGTSTNDNVAGGGVGEFISSVILSSSPVSLTNNTAANITSISLTAGDWDVEGNVGLVTSSLGASLLLSWCSTTSATTPNQALYNSLAGASASIVAGAGLSAPYLRVSVNTTTTVYLSTFATFSGTATACGGIYARRVR